MKERHWSSLVASVRHGQTILVLGAEVPAILAKDAREAQFQIEGLCNRLCAELAGDDRQPSGKGLPALAQQFEDAPGFGPSALRALAEEFYSSTPYEPSEVHRAIARLPFALILSSSHGDLFERALSAAGKDPISQYYHFRGDKRENSEFAVPGSPKTPVIYHLFGSASQPASLVLSENDLLDFLIRIVSERPPLPNSLVRALKRSGQSFLFLGFGIKQWYPRLLLKLLLRIFELQNAGSAFAAEPLLGLSDSDREQTVLFYERGTRIQVLDVEVAHFLEELTKRLTAAGGYAGRIDGLGRRPKVFVSYASEDAGLAARISERLSTSQLDPWIDKEGLRGGLRWDQQIEEELDASDFFVVVSTPALARKTDSYVNKEIALATRRALNVRGAYLIPVRTSDSADDDRIPELHEYQELRLDPAKFDEDMSKLVSHIVREYQRRSR